MKLATRRLIAGVAVSATALGVTLVSISTASAADTLSPATASDSAASNTITTLRTLSFKVTKPFPHAGDPDGVTGTQIEFVRTGSDPEDLIVGDVVDEPSPPGGIIKAEVDFGPGTTGTQAPANPGRYDVYIYVGDRSAGDMCTGCFTVIASQPTVTSISPAQLPTGVQGQSFIVTGTNFAKSSRLEAYLPGTETLDPKITFTAAKSGTNVITNTSTKITKTIRVDPLTTPGFRDIRVTNTDTQSGTLGSALRITTIFVSSIEPNAANNTSVSRHKITGRGFPVGATADLVDETGGRVISGTNVDRPSDTTLSADFDTTNVPTGAYRVRVNAPDGSTSTPECSPVFTVLNTGGSSSGTAATKASSFSCAAATAASPSPSASASRSASATPTATMSPSRSATATATMSPSNQCRTASVQINGARTINATGKASVTITGAQPGSEVELQGYSQNHQGDMNFDNDPTPVDRSATADDNGAATFNDIGPSSNTRFRARQVGCPYGDENTVLEVRAQETLTVTRNGTRSYVFSGRSIPARPGGLIVSLYRITGTACAAGVEPSRCPGETFIGQARAVALGSPGEGLYRIAIRFPVRDQNTRDEFVVKTGRDAQNAPGRSNVRSLLIN
ncbi:MAG: hypothetical protein LC789_06140 [Actinobacteria bacterium]|nr:hypothetical protein [Actinomycetota bacterium]MCA1720259.1 hypothetical protein [Actinomycetota bacterium]